MSNEAVKKLRDALDQPLPSNKPNFFLRLLTILLIILSIPAILWVAVGFILVCIPWILYQVTMYLVQGMKKDNNE